MRVKMKAFLLAAGLAVSSLALSAASEAKTLRVAMGADAVSFDPIATSDNGSIWTQLLIYDTLIRPDKAGTGLEPGLAESWTVSDDGLTLTFKLRDAKFSDGTPVTPQDVEFSLRRAASEKSDWGRFFRPITGYEIRGANEIVMTLEKPFTPAFNNLALFSAAILPKAKVEAEGDAFFEHPVGSGPFVLKEWSRGSKIVLAANPNYWQAGKPAVEGAELDIVAEGSARVIKLEAGESDLILDPPLNQLKALDAKDGISVGQVVPYRSDFVMLNNTKPPFDQEKVRQALNYAIDRQALIKGVLYNAGKVAASAMPVMAYADPALEPYPYDPAKAKALLAEAGVTSLNTTMLVNSSNAAHRNTAVALQAMLGAVGVKIDIQMIEGGTMWETTKAGNYEMALSYATSDTIDPDQLIGFLAVNPERANAYHTQWKNEQLNALYAEERSTINGEKRGQQFQEMVRLFQTGAPDIFLYHPASAWAVRDEVKGFEILPTSNFRLEDVTFAE